jgi:tetratricopeptide (TPR) repeat protein
MNTRSPSPPRNAGLLVAVLIGSTVSVLGAQQPPLRAGQRAGPKFVVPTLRGDSSALGFQVARAVRERLASDFDMRALWVVPESTITEYLVRSGFPADKPLTVPETRQLANAFRADEFINGSVARTATGGFRIQADWSLGARTDMVQPLPVLEATKVSDLAKLVSNEFQAARRQMEFVRKCMDLARTRNYVAAVAEARKAIAAYPRSVFGRVCVANIYDEQKLGPDSMIRITREILDIHPGNQRALAFAADAYGEKGATEDQIRVLRALRDLDPSSRRVGVALVRALATAGRYAEARPYADSLAELHPSDVEVTDLQVRVLYAMKEWAPAVAAARRLIALDSTSATAELYTRLITAAQEAGDVPLASALAEAAVERFPTNDELPLLHAETLRRTNDYAGALAVIDKVLERSPRAPNAWLLRARTQADMGAVADSVAASLTRGVENGEDRGTVARFATALGAAVARSGSPDTVTALRTAIEFYKLADGVQARDSTAYYIGATSVSLAQRLSVEARSARRCESVKEMQSALVDAQVYLVKGGRAFPKPAAERLEYVPPLTTYADQLAKALCR